MAGSFQEDAICDLFENRLADLKKQKERSTSAPVLYVPEYKVKVKEVEQSHICLGIKGVPQEDDLFYPMILLNSIIGGSMSSRLFQNIREEKGLAYSVYSNIQSYVNDGIFSIYAGVSHEKVRDTLAAVAEELHILSQKGVTEDELLIAKEQFKSSYVFSQENVSSRMFSNGKSLLLLSHYLSPREVIDKIDAVNMNDMEQSFRKIVDMRQYSGMLIGNKEFDLKESLKGI